MNELLADFLRGCTANNDWLSSCPKSSWHSSLRDSSSLRCFCQRVARSDLADRDLGPSFDRCLCLQLHHWLPVACWRVLQWHDRAVRRDAHDARLAELYSRLFSWSDLPIEAGAGEDGIYHLVILISAGMMPPSANLSCCCGFGDGDQALRSCRLLPEQCAAYGLEVFDFGRAELCDPFVRNRSFIRYRGQPRTGGIES